MTDAGFTIVDVAGGVLLAAVTSAYIFRDRDARVRTHRVGERKAATHGRRRRTEGVCGCGRHDVHATDRLHASQTGSVTRFDGESSALPEPPVGTEVKIAYEPAMPSTARLVAPASLSSERSGGDVIGFAVLTLVGTLVTCSFVP